MGMHEVIELIRVEYPTFATDAGVRRRWTEEFARVPTAELLDAARRMLRDEHKSIRTATLWKYLRAKLHAERDTWERADTRPRLSLAEVKAKYPWYDEHAGLDELIERKRRHDAAQATPF